MYSQHPPPPSPPLSILILNSPTPIIYIFFSLIFCPLMETNEIPPNPNGNANSPAAAAAAAGATSANVNVNNLLNLNVPSSEVLRVNLTVGYMTGSSRKPGDQEYSRPGLTISGALTLAFTDLKNLHFFRNIHIYTNGTELKESLSAAGLSLSDVANIHHGHGHGHATGHGQGHGHSHSSSSSSSSSSHDSSALVSSGEKSSSLASHNVELSFFLEIVETFGNEETSVRQVANLWRQNVSVIIGPQESCLHEAKMAASLNIPMISYYCSDEETSDKNRFSTFSRTRPPDTAISRAVASLLLKYGWTHSLTVIYSDSSDDQRFRRVAKSLSILLQKQNVTTREGISYRGPYYHGYVDNPFDSIIAQTKDKTRIYVVISEYFEHLGVVLALEKHKLLDKGEYLVIGVSMDDFKEEEWNPRRYFKGLLHDEVDKVDPVIFRSYIGIVASPPRNFTNFSHRVNHFMEKEPFNFPNPLKPIGGYKKIRVEAAYLYDAVILYAQALQSIIEEHGAKLSRTSASSNANANADSNANANAINKASTTVTTYLSNPSTNFNANSNANAINSADTASVNNNNSYTVNSGRSSSSSRGSVGMFGRGYNNPLELHSGGGATQRRHSVPKLNRSQSGSRGSGHGGGHSSHSGGSGSSYSIGGGSSSESYTKKSLHAQLLDGREISWRLRKISYRSATGHESEMDENGDAKGNFTLVSLKRKNGEIGLFPVGFFKQSHDLPELELTEEIEWVAGSPPVSEPRCGFSGEKCKRDDNVIIVSSVLVVLIVLISSGSYLIFRHWRLSRDMDTILWRIDKRDIHWENGQFFPVNRGSQASLAKFSTVFAPLVTYRERIFAAKAIDTDLLDSTMKHQLKLLREIRHENLNAFIGACLYDEGILLIQEYCSRGSIKDILDNEDLKLDDMFVSSLVGDLLRGLSYLHDSSQFRFHGNLKPTNCLVDSRWVLRLSDFGLTYARKDHYISHTADLILSNSTGPSGGSGGNGGGGSGKLGGYNGATTRISFANSTATTSITRTGSGNYNSSVRASVSRMARVTTSPYLPPEFSEIFKTTPNRSLQIENHRKGDMYSLGVILWELLVRKSLGSFLGMKVEREIRAEIISQGMTFWAQVLSNLHHSSANNEPPPPGSPSGNSVAAGQNIIPPTIVDCLKDCLSFDPDQRPDIKSVRLRLRPLHKGMRSNIFDIMIGLMEKYANNLEILVDERTKQLSEEKRKTDSLLYELIPASVAEELKEGLRVPAQNYDCVSIYFSDIVGFTSMSAQSSAFEVVEFLNDLYTCFDSVIENFDVYKVETIGDAYMVASGLPVVREGNFHAYEMARMALQLLKAVTNFRIRHRPNETVKLRIGVHSGPCCAGVVGLKRPRYCLFGDTVNTASRMESTGLPLRIHCSQTFANLVDDGFIMERRGVLDVKGKGDMTTFWLLGPIRNSPSSAAAGVGANNAPRENKSESLNLTTATAPTSTAANSTEVLGPGTEET